MIDGVGAAGQQGHTVMNGDGVAHGAGVDVLQVRYYRRLLLTPALLDVVRADGHGAPVDSSG